MVEIYDSVISESKTKNVFRDFYGSTTFIENSAIPKSYGFKSKKGTAYKEYPDFFLDFSDFAIIVETKALKHSLAEEQVKWYMTNNSISKNIIGIAISGQDRSQMKITYYYLDSKRNPLPFNVHDKFVSLENLRKILNKHLADGSNSSNELLKTINHINKVFDSNNVKDTERSLLFSGMMIALTNDNFRNTYKNITKPSEEKFTKTPRTISESFYLSDAMVEAINKQLNSKINNLSKQIRWRDQFAFIRNVEFNLNDYKQILNEIYDKIFVPFQNEEKQDILGKAYKIFLSRAGKIDNKNIIITPDHIKELMVKLARINLNDVVLDTCTGTGGFLIEAMEKLNNLAQDDKKKLKEIREHKLIGFENDSTLFALACSNMLLHGNGCSNMLYRSSLLKFNSKNKKIINNKDQKVFEYIRKQKPTKCIINPPYENNYPIKFVKQAIDYLEPNGKLIVIMPSPTLTQNQHVTQHRNKIQESERNYGLTGEILKSARLDYVIKLPLNLFTEQNRIVNVSIFGFTKKPHEQKDEVLFCKLKDDGLVSIQHKGRVDRDNRWNDIENKLLDIIRNRKEVENVSEIRKIWKDGELNCSGFPKSVELDNNLVPLKELFSMKRGSLASSKAISNGKYNFVTASDTWKKADYADQKGAALVYVVSASGSLGKCQYVDGNFVASNLCLVFKEKNHDKYPVNLKFYKWYLSSIKDQILDDLANGTSKLTINKKSLENYYVEYFPIEKQEAFVKKYVSKYEKLLSDVNNLKNKLTSEINLMI